MTKQEYIASLREAVLAHVSPNEAAKALAALAAGHPWTIFEELDFLRSEGILNGQEFEQLLTDFFWEFCY